jgi:radical SAM protein with 4Fe4S-binding SPASM domain
VNEKNVLSRFKKSIDSVITEVYYRRYFAWGLPTRRFIQVNLETNSVCTRACHYCLFGIRKVPVTYMSPQLFFNIIDQLVDMRFIGRISLFEINEPLTDGRIYDFTKYVSSVLPDCYHLMVTNGDLLTQERFKALMESRLDLLVINSYDAESLIKNEYYFKYSADKYPDRVWHCDRTNYNGWESRAGHIKQYKGDAIHTFCEYPNYILYIKPDGRVLACWNDFDGENVMGNLNEDTIEKIWYGERFEKFRKFINKGDRKVSDLCNGCDHKPDVNYMKWNKMLAKKKLKNKVSFTDMVKARLQEDAMAIKRKYLEYLR